MTLFRQIRRGPALILLAAASAWLGACSPGDPELVVPAASLDRPLRQVMYQVDFAYREVRINLRNTTYFPRHRELLDAVAEWVEDPSWQDWVEAPTFEGDPARFLGFRAQLRESTAAARRAAETDDVAGLREGFLGMYSSCIACHKRFKPTY